MCRVHAVFMATYAAGNIINGKLGDTFNPTTILAIGLFGSGACLFLINVAIWYDFKAINSTFGDAFILAVYFLFGLFQATGGPVGTAVMGNWFCDPESIKKRGTIFGFWTCHQYMGDITAALCTAWVLGAGLTYWWALLIPAVSNAAWAFLTMQLVADPVNVGIETPELKIRRAKMEAQRLEGEIVDDKAPPPISYIDAIRIPMVAQYAIAFGFFKVCMIVVISLSRQLLLYLNHYNLWFDDAQLTNYVLFFWLPYFLGKSFDPVTSNLIAALYSVGMMPGGIIVGYVSDFFGGRRAVVIGVFMATLIVFLGFFAMYSDAGMSPIMLLVMLGCMGILVGG
jgi:MFS transporter, OPA family, solute carrier family 37 (glycerol-3-phosphate transporter), member 1/2